MDFYNMNSRPRHPVKASSPHSRLLPLQETTGMLQSQLREAQRELARAAQQHRDDLTALQQEGSSLRQDKISLQKQVPLPLSQPHSLSLAEPGCPAPSCRTREPWELGRGRVGPGTEWKIEGCSGLSPLSLGQ